MRALRTLCCAAALTAFLAPPALADEFNKLTYLTFSGPVEIPGVTLAAGTYAFKLADPETGRRVIRITDKEGKQIYATLLSIPNQRLTPGDQPVVMFGERASGSPQAVKAWFYPGETIGYEFVYLRQQAVTIAKAAREPVLSIANNSAAAKGSDQNQIDQLKGASVSRVDERGESSANAAARARETSRTAAAPAPSRQTARPAPADRGSSPARTPAGTVARATPGQNEGRVRALPSTSSTLVLVMLLSGMAFAGALATRLLRKHCDYVE